MKTKELKKIMIIQLRLITRKKLPGKRAQLSGGKL
jgi:hypothetical protein